MRIAVVVTGGLHPSGRDEVMPARLALLERLARRHDVHAFALRHLDEPANYELGGVSVHDLGRPSAPAGLGRLAQWRALAAALARTGPFDLLHAFWADPPGLVAALAARRLGVPCVVTCSSGEFIALDDVGYGLQRTWPGRTAVRMACRLASRVHVPTRYMQALARTHGVEALCMPMGVDPSVMGPGVAAAPASDRPPWHLLQVASLNPVKDQRVLLDAVAIARRMADVRLDLVGEDTLGGALHEHARRLGIAERVRFHGRLPHDRLAPLYCRAHLYVQSSRHEGAGAAVLDAAAAGLPVVGTRVGYVHDWAPDAADAVPPGDAAALAAAIVSMLRAPERRATLASRARDFALAYSVDWTADRLSELYAELTP